MPKDQVTSEAVTQAVLHRITTGQYLPGERLPSVRDMALEIGSTRNTVNKAYQALLDLGVIETCREGRRGFVIKTSPRVNRQSRAELLDYFYRQAVDLVWEGMAAGVTSDELFDRLKAALGSVYGHSQVGMIFFECNEHDTQEMGRQLNSALGMEIEYRVLDVFYHDVPEILDKYDLLITTYHHLAEINHAIREHHGPKGKLVGIDTRPTPETMLRIARLPNPRIGIVCTNANTAHMLKHILYGYHPEWEIEATSLEEGGDKIHDLARGCDHFIVTHTSAEEVTILAGRAPDVVVQFQIDEQSVLYLKQRIYEIQMEKMHSLHAALSAGKEVG